MASSSSTKAGAKSPDKASKLKIEKALQKDESKLPRRLVGIIARVGRGTVEIKIGSEEAQEASRPERDEDASSRNGEEVVDDKTTETIIEVREVPDLPMEPNDVFEANVTLKSPNVAICRGLPLVIIPSTGKAIVALFRKFIRNEQKSRTLYRKLVELHESPDKVVEMLSNKASHWYKNRNSFPDTTIRQTNALLKFWYAERNLRQLLLLGLNKKEIFVYLKYAERSTYQMIGDLLTNPSAIFNVDAFKLKSLTKITGRMFWENVHQFLRQVFAEMFTGKLYTAITELTEAEEMLLSDMPVHIDDNIVYLNYAYSIRTDLQRFLSRLQRSKEVFAANTGEFEIPERFNNDSSQREAFTRAIKEPFIVIEGYAGTGKSELLLYIFNTLISLNRKVGLGAFTGKASANLAKGAKRNILSMAAQRQFNPRTLHSLNKSKAAIETLLIDEISMLSADLLVQITREHPEISQIILVGDIAQLPPMGIGHLLASINQQNYCVSLTQTHRFDGDLLDVATAIRKGQSPKESENFTKLEGTADTVVALVKNFLDLPGCDINDLAVITYYNKTVDTINFEIQKLLRKKGLTERGTKDQKGHLWNIGDRIIFLENNPDIHVWNGQEGRVHSIEIGDDGSDSVVAAFDGIQIKLATQWADRKDNTDEKEDEKLEDFKYTPVDELTTREIRLAMP